MTTPSGEQLLEAVVYYGNPTAAAKALGMPRSTLVSRLQRFEEVHRLPAPHRRNGRSKPRLTREALREALLPPNPCRVLAFRETLDPESQEVLDEAIGYQQRDFPASRLRALLIGLGFSDSEVPGVEAISAHRNGRKPCRCKG